jgi:hypothetical protein
MVPSLVEINNAENGYLGRDGAPVLGESFEMLLTRWAAGERDRETALRLLFLSWYCNAEPPFLTGLPAEHDTATTCWETFAALGGVGTSDPEVCFVVGLMAQLFPWCLGDEAYWVELGRVLAGRAVELQPNGPSPTVFSGRGAYGEYFSHMLSARAGS